MPVTPMMAQYLSVKEKYKDSILFFRLGDFYEMFFDDAKLVSRELNLVLTGKDCGLEERAPMCGIPYHSSETYIGRLVNKGYKVVICEQTEDPAAAKGLVKRDVVRIVTPGTLIETDLLDEGKNNFLCTIAFDGDSAGLCFADVSTAEARGTVLFGDDISQRIINELAAYMPREVLINIPAENVPQLSEYISVRIGGMLDDRRIDYFDVTSASDLIFDRFGKSAGEMGAESTAAVSSFGAMLRYLEETYRTQIPNIKNLKFYSEDQYLQMDASSRRNLELCETIRGREKRGTLLWVLDRTRTSMGARLLRRYIEKPLRNASAISARLDAVEQLYGDFMLRSEISETLAGVLDLERLMAKVAYGTANAKDLLAIGKTLSVIPYLKQLLAESGADELQRICNRLSPEQELFETLLRAVSENASALVREGGMIADGYSEEVDELRNIINNSKDYKTKMETRERERTGIKTLKIGYNRVFGYYIEVSKSYVSMVPENYIRKQTLTTGERYITDELKNMEATILGAVDKLNALEYEIFCGLRDMVSEKADIIAANADCFAVLDVYCSLASVAFDENYVRPEIEYSDVLEIHDGRHPVVEKFVQSGGFVPNDTVLDTDHNRLMLITGPNMAGKSTYMRQVALIAIMAQIGSFVPASSARIGIVDRLFTRVGASDDLASGTSTFMLEMNEVAYILKNATKRSLIIYDEIGRGTSTFDGMSIARAVAEYTAGKKLGARTLFATHYHELTALADEIPGVVNYSIAAKKKGDELIFLRRIVKGAADDSYGIEVAKLAGVPGEVIRRARVILGTLEKKSEAADRLFADDGQEEPDENVSFEDIGTEELRRRISELDMDMITPRDALELLYDLKKLVY
ncbi:MAG: DNA mismatch repair protein MutS [Oscillospiraceae bacterium]|nr:MAG: DNA mismatch repair protein MutS [Oscillospiraceae bacterium]